MRCSVSKEPAAEPPFFVTPFTLHRLSAFASGDGDFFHCAAGKTTQANETAAFRTARFPSFCEWKYMNPSERRLADAFTPEKARQVIKILRNYLFSSQLMDFFYFSVFFHDLVFPIVSYPSSRSPSLYSLIYTDDLAFAWHSIIGTVSGL